VFSLIAISRSGTTLKPLDYFWLERRRDYKKENRKKSQRIREKREAEKKVKEANKKADRRGKNNPVVRPRRNRWERWYNFREANNITTKPRLQTLSRADKTAIKESISLKESNPVNEEKSRSGNHIPVRHLHTAPCLQKSTGINTPTAVGMEKEHRFVAYGVLDEQYPQQSIETGKIIHLQWMNIVTPRILNN
jgi:hypothetical protein